jgi:acyl dehydratase
MTQTKNTITGGITDEELAEMQSFVNAPIVIEQFNDQAGHDVVKHYAWGIGDLNPLYLDEEYAKRSRFGTRIAPPCFIYSVCDAEVARGLPEDVQPLHTASQVKPRRAIQVGEWVRAESNLDSVESITGRRGGRMARQKSSTYYYVGDELVSSTHQTILCVRHAAGHSAGGAHKVREMSSYTEEEYAAIDAEVLAEKRRGDNPRYVEDLRVGDLVPQVIKGPLDQMAMTAYYSGAVGSAGYRGVETRVHVQERVRQGSPDAPTNFDAHHWLARTSPSIGHQNPEYAKKVGMPGPYDNGNQRTAWVAHCITNWMGDDADLLEVTVRLDGANVFGDTLRISGTVTEVGTDGIATLDLVGINQLGEKSTSAIGRVRLPRRG